MQRVVVDSSVIVKWLIQDNELYVDKANQLLQDVSLQKVTLIAPELAKYEVGNAILKKGLTSAQAFQSLATVYSLPITFIPETEELGTETYQMAEELKLAGNIKFTYYDASFAALAKQENAVLVTDNPKHQAKIQDVFVIPLEKYI